MGEKATATTITAMHMSTNMPESHSSRLRLLQLASPSLPVGAFAYSQGLEWAVHSGSVDSEAETAAWCKEILEHGLACVDLPILVRMMEAWRTQDLEAMSRWSAELLAMRETRELREEEAVRGRAMLSLLKGLEIQGADRLSEIPKLSQLCTYAAAAVRWEIPTHDAVTGYAWSWLENTIMAAIKLVPLGQLSGQRLLLTLSDSVEHAVSVGLTLEDDEIGGSLPGLAIASCQHETQYSRLFRS